VTKDRAPLFVWALLLSLIFCAPSAQAQAQAIASEPAREPDTARHRLVYQKRWRRFELVDYVTSATIGMTFVYVHFYAKPPLEPNWTGPILFDRRVRDALVGGSRDARNNAGVVSDVLWYVPLLLPFFESALVPLFSDHFNVDVAWQLSAINLQSAAVNALLTRSGHRFVARERPDVGPCSYDESYDDHCFGGSNASFPSGHASAAFMGAGLACAHHSNLPLYGGGAPDVAVCVATTAMAVGNGFARIVADRHYASDVIAGAAIGAMSGLAMPVLLHYGGFGNFSEPSDSKPASQSMFTPLVWPQGAGAVWSGFF
jgi:membrane-associated phospholipid phosphatase